MDKKFIEELVKQVIADMANDEETLSNEMNVAGDVAGFDAPMGTKKQKRKFPHDDDEDE